MDAIVGFVILLGGGFAVVATLACLYHKPGQFRYSVGDLLYTTLFAAASVSMFTLPYLPDTDAFWAVRVFAGVAFGGAAIGTLFNNAGVGAMLTLLAFILLGMMMGA